jgi:hypothetical protein
LRDWRCDSPSTNFTWRRRDPLLAAIAQSSASATNRGGDPDQSDLHTTTLRALTRAPRSRICEEMAIGPSAAISERLRFGAASTLLGIDPVETPSGHRRRSLIATGRRPSLHPPRRRGRGERRRALES